MVSLIDLTKAPPGETVTLEKLAAGMINGDRQRRSRWEQSESDVQIAGTTAKRITWSGAAAEPGFGQSLSTFALKSTR